MDVKFSSSAARVGGALLALTACCGTVTRNAAAADESSTMEFVTATDASAGYVESSDIEQSPAAEASDLVIQIAEEAPAAMLSTPTVAQAVAPPARGDLTVVANVVQRGPVSRVIIDSEVTPAAHTSGGLNWSRVLGSGPRRPSSMAGIQDSRRSQTYSAPRYGNAGGAAIAPVIDAPLAYDADAAFPTAINARHDIPAARAVTPATPPAITRLKSPADHAKELLVNAHQLSLTAQNESEYSQIIQWCASAMRANLDGETRKFGTNLSAWALNRRGQSRADEGELDLALADFRAALEFSPDNYRALHNRAVTHAQAGQFAEAFDDLCHVIQLKPDFAKAYSNRATLYVQAGDFDHALADYEAALAADPELLPALVGHGRVCHMQGKLDAALISLSTAVAVEPQDAEIVCSRADLLADLGRYEDALVDYAQAIDLNPKFEHAYRNGAWLLATCPDDEIRDVEGALAGAQAALDCGYGERHAALDTMAAALANAGKFEEAVGTLQQALEIAPEENRTVYEARLQLYEAGQPFRTHPVGVTPAATSVQSEPADDAQAAVYVEQ